MIGWLRARRWAVVVLAGLLVLLGLLAASLWLLASDGGVRWLAAAATSLSRGQLAIEGLQGHLGTPIAIRQLVITSDTQRITLQRVRLEWQPRALWQRRLRERPSHLQQ